MDEIETYVSGEGGKEERNENEKSLLNIFLKQFIEVLVDIMKERLQYQGSAHFYKIFICMCRAIGL